MNAGPKSSKEKAMGKMQSGMNKEAAAPSAKGTKLSDREEHQRKVRFTVEIEKKIMDGKEVCAAKLIRDNDSYYPMVTSEPGKDKKPPKPPIPQEYTDMVAFGKCVADELASASKAIMAVKD